MQDESKDDRGEDLRWTRALLARKDIARVDEPGSWFQYRPGRLLVDSALADRDDPAGRELRALLGASKAERDPGELAGVAKRLGLELYEVPDSTDLPALVESLARAAPRAASLDHVLVADPHRYGGTSPAIPADRPGDIPGDDGSIGKGLTVAVLDTGSGAQEIPDEDADQDLDPAAGHGTFVTGVIGRYAPGAEVISVRVLQSPVGIASELEVAQALLDLPQVDVINCSFGGPAQSDAAPLVIERALATLPPATVVVAAAGNQGLDRPHWPAASKRVFAIASVEGGRGYEGWDPADYSNHGWWVDAASPGSHVHSTFLEFEETGPLPNRTFKGGAEWSGTSFATPQVAAAVLALASRDGIPVREAAYRLIEDPDRLRIGGVGTLVLPTHLPA